MILFSNIDKKKITLKIHILFYFSNKMKWLIYGSRGWIGSYFCNFIKGSFPEIQLVLQIQELKI